MKDRVLRIKYKIDEWLFDLGFLEGVHAKFDNGKIVEEWAYGFTFKRRKCE